MKSHLCIREAEIADAERLSVFATQTFIATYTDLPNQEAFVYVSKFFSVSRFQTELSCTSTQVLVAENEELLGYTLLQPNAPPQFVRGTNPIECVRLFIDLTAQGQRIGSQLLERSMQSAKQRDYDYCWLKVWDQNPNTIRFYEKHHFKTLGSASYTEGGMDDQVFILGRFIYVRNKNGV